MFPSLPFDIYKLIILSEGGGGTINNPQRGVGGGLFRIKSFHLAIC